jgi:hypothetical protein
MQINPAKLACPVNPPVWATAACDTFATLASTPSECRQSPSHLVPTAPPLPRPSPQSPLSLSPRCAPWTAAVWCWSGLRRRDCMLVNAANPSTPQGLAAFRAARSACGILEKDGAWDGFSDQGAHSEKYEAGRGCPVPAQPASFVLHCSSTRTIMTSFLRVLPCRAWVAQQPRPLPVPRPPPRYGNADTPRLTLSLAACLVLQRAANRHWLP